MPDDREDTNLAERSLELDSIELAAAIFGSGDQNIHLLEKEFRVTAVCRGSVLRFTGEQRDVDAAARAVDGMVTLMENHTPLEEQTVRYCISLAHGGEEKRLRELTDDFVAVTAKGRPIHPKTLGQKEYLAGLRLGLVTDTQDTSGAVLEERPAAVTPGELEAVLPRFRGPIQQVPPMYSAIKIQGKKLYELARKGREVERPPRPITIHSLTVEDVLGPDRFLLRVRCSKGTYVRTLCHDIGAALGCGGCMYSLRRTMAAGFTLAEAVTLEQAAQGREALLQPTDSFFRDCPAVALTTPRQEKLCRNGNPVPFSGLEEHCRYRVYSLEGDFLCLSRYREGQLVSIKNFFGG